MDRSPRNLVLLVLGCTLLFSPALLLADPQETPDPNTKNRRLQVLVQGPAEGLKTGMAKSEWQRLRLLTLSRRLDRDLADFESASQWQSFLRVPQDVMILKNAGRQNRKKHSLNNSLQRFSQVAEEKQYETIASLDSFRAMHLALQSYAASREIESQNPESSVTDRYEYKFNQADDSKHQPDLYPAIDRLPPVLISGDQPHLITPPDQSQVQ